MARISLTRIGKSFSGRTVLDGGLDIGAAGETRRGQHDGIVDDLERLGG